MTRSNVVVGKTGDSDEGREHRQDAIPDQRGSTDLGRGQLSETVAIEFAAPGEAVADAGDEYHQENQRQKRSPSGGSGGDQKDGDGQLGNRQRNPARSGEPFRDAKRPHRGLRPGKIEKFGDTRYREHRGEDQPSHEQQRIHALETLVRQNAKPRLSVRPTEIHGGVWSSVAVVYHRAGTHLNGEPTPKSTVRPILTKGKH
ncbi:MAG: hypothetical protein K0Q89_2023 [Thermomicrobiales bacterium]|nr:hypothetical protein [Thermomicrobiales bacterium]